MKTKLVTVIIVNFNGKEWLKGLLPNLTNQTYKNIQIIIVDNNSSDESTNYVTTCYKSIKLISCKKNEGFAAGNNMGIEKADGEYIILLNNDTWVPKDYVENFIRVFDKYPNCGIAQSKILFMNESKKIDSCGSFLTSWGFQYYIGNNKSSNLKKYNKPFKIFSVKGASMIFKKSILIKIDMFNTDYWSYYEETDLCHRALMQNYEIMYWPETYILHAIGGTSTKFPNKKIQFHNYKNKMNSLITNLETYTLFKILPKFIFLNILISFVWILRGQFGNSMSIYKAFFWILNNLRKIYLQRIRIQSNRKVNDGTLFKEYMKFPSIKYYYYLLNNNLNKYSDQI